MPQRRSPGTPPIPVTMELLGGGGGVGIRGWIPPPSPEVMVQVVVVVLL